MLHHLTYFLFASLFWGLQSDLVGLKVNQTVEETDKIVPVVANLAERQRFIDAKRNLVNAAAGFVTAGTFRFKLDYEQSS